MGLLDKLETILQERLVTKAPVKIPPRSRKMLATSLWWIALLAAVAALYSAITLWQWGHLSVRLSDAVTYTTAYVHHLGLFYYLTIASMAVVALLLLLAAPSLKPMKESGWKRAYCALLVQALSAVLLLFADGGGLVDFLGAAVVTIAGAYLLFQVRGSFIAAHPRHDGAQRKPYGNDDAGDKPAATGAEEETEEKE
ncbi:MAG TPA: hypothetical protein VGO07_00390 [Candidatus Saccharimonadales bacterium]|jgi:hypothetical protein|nr:hypothetical protein [Candidatus Saccharimonadales bacterium]